jgi:hypothetical protein
VTPLDHALLDARVRRSHLDAAPRGETPLQREARLAARNLRDHQRDLDRQCAHYGLPRIDCTDDDARARVVEAIRAIVEANRWRGGAYSSPLRGVA